MAGPRYGPQQRVLLEVQPDRPVENAGVAFDTIKRGFEGVQKVIRPAVVQEQTALGEEQALEAFNKGTFETAKPFSVRSAAFNETGGKLISNKAAIQMDEGVQAAMKRANGSVPVFQAEMQKLRAKIMDGLPAELPGLATDLQGTYDRAFSAGTRQMVALAERRAIAAQRAAASEAAAILEKEVDTLALTGGSAEELTAALASGQDRLASYGPRGEFTVNGKTYAADPSRSGILSADQVRSKAEGLSERGHKIFLEADFLQSDAPGEYARNFRERVFAGDSPFDAGTSLEMIRSFDSRARSNEAQMREDQRRAEAELDDAITDTFEGFVQMAEAGVPVAIPPGERDRLRAELALNPDKLAEAERKFSAADAIVETAGMSHSQVLEYRDSLVATASAAGKKGELDLDSAAQLEAIANRVKAAEAAITAETIGLTPARDLLAEGGYLTDDDFAGLRERAGGKGELLEDIAELESATLMIRSGEGMTAAQREEQLETLRKQLQTLATKGSAAGQSVAIQLAGAELALERSQRIAELAASDPVKFATAKGIALDDFAGADTMQKAGSIIVSRVRAVEPAAAVEGVDDPVPITDTEAAAIVEVFRNSTSSDRVAFLGEVSSLDRDQALAVFKRLGMEEPALLAAGVAQVSNNGPAARLILRGVDAPKTGGGTPTDVNEARASVLGPVMSMLTGQALQDMDEAALAYARGAASADGGREMTVADLEAGYQVATGVNQDGNGGVQVTQYGGTILPPGVSAGAVSRSIAAMTPEKLATLTGGASVVDRMGRTFTAEELEYTIEGLRPHPTKEGVLIPVDGDGAAFGISSAEGETVALGILEFDIEELTRDAPAPGFFGRLFGGE